MSVKEAGWSGFVADPSSTLSLRGSDALEKLLNEFSFESVLDIGCNVGAHTREFMRYGKNVSSIDLYACDDFVPDCIGDYLTMHYSTQFDAIWCCHVLEHNMDSGMFIRKIYSDLKLDGVCVITVPPAKHDIVNGHVSIWNAGLLLYNMVLCGFDCSAAAVKTYGYNISVIVKKRPACVCDVNTPIEELEAYFPIEVRQGFDGRITSINW